jgi:hypothetical protein
MPPFTCQSVPTIPGSPLRTRNGPRITAPIDPVPQPVRGLNIGVVVFSTHKGERAEAVLDAGGRWRCPALPVLERPLDALHGPRPESGGDMPFGHAELIRAAAWLKGVATMDSP